MCISYFYGFATLKIHWFKIVMERVVKVSWSAREIRAGTNDSIKTAGTETSHTKDAVLLYLSQMSFAGLVNTKPAYRARTAKCKARLKPATYLRQGKRDGL